MIPSSVDRVPAHTADPVNRRIRQQIRENVERTAAAGPEAIDRRLRELAQEWDVERTIEANASTLVFLGTVLGAFVNLWFLLLPAAVSLFLLQHAIQGWCPPIPVLRRWGFRTAYEIEEERNALKALRGDYQAVHTPDEALAATRH